MENIELLDLNTQQQSTDDNELEDFQLPPLTVDSVFGDYFSYSDTGSPFSEQNSVYYSNFDDFSDSSVDIVEINYQEENIITETFMGDSERKTPDETNFCDAGMNLKKCHYCHKNVMLKTMFILKYDDSECFICLKCSVNISECRMLKDWEKEPNSLKTKICPRCSKEKSYYRFRNNNKYCDYCLLKKKWLRLRAKIENSNKNDYFRDDENEETSKTSTRKRVNCCVCNEVVNLQECFLYFECFDDSYSDKKICLDCSLSIKDWRCLRDWEDSSAIKNGRICSRCKKMKSFNRFRYGKSGCGYCSLKRRRLYLLQRR